MSKSSPTNSKNVLVIGASGIIGRAVVRNLGNDINLKVVAASRRPELDLPNNTEPFPIDLSLCDQKNSILLTGVTHLVYCAYVDAPSWEAQRQPNTELFRNSVKLVRKNCPNLQHITLMQGTKAYGAHLGPFKTPAKETDPRIPEGYFYDYQFDILLAQSVAAGWSWTVLRPHVVIGPAFRSPLNLITVIGVYCSLLKAQGRSLNFPGPETAFDALYQATDADLLSRAINWSGSTLSAKNEIFNITNGDFFRWKHVWPKIARLFDMEMGEVEPQDLCSTMSESGALWQEISTQYGLAVSKLDEMVSWRFADYVFGTTWDVMSDSTKIRRHGFNELIDSEDMLLTRLNELRELKVIPR